MKFIFILFLLSWNVCAMDYNSKPRDDDGHSGPDYVIKTLEEIKTPKVIFLTDIESERFKKEEQADIEKDNTKETKIDERDPDETHCEDGNCQLPASGGASGGSDASRQNEPFCKIYDKNLYDVVLMYKSQIEKMTSISDQTSPQMAPQKYLCRAFSNVMLIDEGTSIHNETYIQNAKKDVKTAIEKNKHVGVPFRIKEIDDKMLSEIFRKYGEVITKGMSDEDRQIVSDAINERNLHMLKNQVNENYGQIDSIAGTEGSLKQKENADLSPYYTPEINDILKKINDINPNGDTQTETEALRSMRVTEDGMNTGEARIDDMLDAILLIDEGGKAKW